MKISIITINYNNGHGLENTLKSIINLEQGKGLYYESIIIDGGSNDISLSIIEKYSNIIKFSVSEKDNGIYDAMNKGINHAEGDWLIFMNSGDCFYNANVLTNIYDSGYFNLPVEKAMLLYGDKIQNGIILKSLCFKAINYGVLPACHQSMFFRNIGIRYNIKYKIYSDFDYFLEYHSKYKNEILYLDMVISNTESDGISAHSLKQKRKDKMYICFKRFGLMLTMLMYCKIMIAKCFASKKKNLVGDRK